MDKDDYFHILVDPNTGDALIWANAKHGIEGINVNNEPVWADLTLPSDDEEDAVEVQDSDMEDTNSMDGEGPAEPDFDVEDGIRQEVDVGHGPTRFAGTLLLLRCPVLLRRRGEDQDQGLLGQAQEVEEDH